jgi:ESS family glutamate:Na+ symporter
MTIALGGAATLASAALVLLVGRGVISRVALLRRYAIPEPVAGGLIAAVFIAGLYAIGFEVAFDTSMQPALMLAFFATIGLGADARSLAKGGVPLVIFTLCVVGMLFMENVIGIGAARLMGVDPLIGLIAGSVTMAGGHGTGAAWGQRFAEIFGVTEAPAVGLAGCRRRARRSAYRAPRRCRMTPLRLADRSQPIG